MISALLIAAAAAVSDCGALIPMQSGGDYTDPANIEKLKVVEAYHFTPDVESLRHGASGALGADIGYTLEHFPNHHRALAAMVRLTIKEQKPQPQGARYSTECFFDRALRFSKDDTQVRRLYAGYLLAARRDDDAIAQLNVVLKSDPKDATSHYNLGLLHVRKKQWEPALSHAREAYALGFPLPGLRNKLADAGHPLPPQVKTAPVATQDKAGPPEADEPAE